MLSSIAEIEAPADGYPVHHHYQVNHVVDSTCQIGKASAHSTEKTGQRFMQIPVSVS